jgi:Rieske Fe-S protein
MQNESSCTRDGCTHAVSQEAKGAGIDRRTFLGHGAVAAALLALTGCSLDATGPSYGPSVGSSIVVADYPELTNVGGVAMVSYKGSPVAIERTGDTTFLALSRVCPHQGNIVNAISGGFLCPRHGARYDANGTWIGGQPTHSLRSIATAYDVSTDTLTIG